MSALRVLTIMFKTMMKTSWTLWKLGSIKIGLYSVCLVFIFVFIISMLGITMPVDVRDIIGILRTSERPSRLCVNYDGRLGNVLFRFASMYGIAKSKAMVPFIPKDIRLFKLFELNGITSVQETLVACSWFKRHKEIRSVAFDEESVHFSNVTDIALSGYFQSFKYFKESNDELREVLRVKAELLNVVRKNLYRQTLQQVQQSGIQPVSQITYVGIHVRRGDMVTEERFSDFGYLVGSKEYIEHARQFYLSRYARVMFVVCSDDLAWCKESISHTDTVFIEGQSPEEDMAMLSLCNHTIMTVGSFGWWSAWLANGTTLYYKHQCRNGSGLAKEFSVADYFPPHWIAME